MTKTFVLAPSQLNQQQGTNSGDKYCQLSPFYIHFLKMRKLRFVCQSSLLITIYNGGLAQWTIHHTTFIIIFERRHKVLQETRSVVLFLSSLSLYQFSPHLLYVKVVAFSGQLVSILVCSQAQPDCMGRHVFDIRSGHPVISRLVFFFSILLPGAPNDSLPFKDTFQAIQSTFRYVQMHSKAPCNICICSVILGQLEPFRNYKGFSMIFPKILDAIYRLTKVNFFSDSSIHAFSNPKILGFFFPRKIALPGE